MKPIAGAFEAKGGIHERRPKKFDNLYVMGKFLERPRCPKLVQNEIESLELLT